ncbi:hypothetical protein PAPYR_4529 [Paratrimastix pyriformis]|uniref:RING-type domain-containing protein n=1 Tax=Paratrimastix pyriformis TaxID=342808 RepID=A0ABQ8URW6_9EUKA|nr:hypothetical protein PAPYR_4529 [Paratrimastix pyriformis]
MEDESPRSPPTVDNPKALPCASCGEDFNLTDHAPVRLDCHHLVGHCCALNLIVILPTPDGVLCPVCRTPSKIQLGLDPFRDRITAIPELPPPDVSLRADAQRGAQQSDQRLQEAAPPAQAQALDQSHQHQEVQVPPQPPNPPDATMAHPSERPNLAQSCQKPVCLACVEAEHEAHELKHLQNPFVELRLRQQLASLAASVRQRCDEATAAQLPEAERALNGMFDQLVAALEARRRQMLAKLRTVSVATTLGERAAALLAASAVGSDRISAGPVALHAQVMALTELLEAPIGPAPLALRLTPPLPDLLAALDGVGLEVTPAPAPAATVPPLLPPPPAPACGAPLDWAWDPADKDPGLELSQANRAALNILPGDASVVGTAGWRQGVHRWTVQVFPVLFLALGVRATPRRGGAGQDYHEAQCWSSGFEWGGPEQGKRTHGDWAGGDMLDMELDCEAHRLRMVHRRTGEVCTREDLTPGQAYRPYLSLYNPGSRALLMPYQAPEN